MALPLSSRASQSSPISRLIEPLNPCIDDSPLLEPAEPMVRSTVSYRSSPDGTVTMGTDSLSGQVALIVLNKEGHWDVALPGQIENRGPCQKLPSLEAAKKMVDAAFLAFHSCTAAA